MPKKPDPRFVGLLAAVGAVNGDGHRANMSRSVTISSVSPRYMKLIVAAARRRDISISAFIKRAAVAIACYDLGVDYNEVSRGEWPVTRFGARGKALIEETRGGQGGGPFRVTGLRE